MPPRVVATHSSHAATRGSLVLTEPFLWHWEDEISSNGSAVVGVDLPLAPHQAYATAPGGVEVARTLLHVRLMVGLVLFVLICILLKM
jgi:hypothetical protein